VTLLGRTAPSGVRLGSVLFGAFIAIQTFTLLVRIDGPSVVFWWDAVAWPVILFYWVKDLGLAMAAGWLAARLLRLVVGADARMETAAGGSHRPLLLAGVIAAGIALRFLAPESIPPGIWYDAPAEIHALLQNPDGIGWLGGTPHSATLANHALTSNLYMKFCSGLFHVFGRGVYGYLAISAVPGILAIPSVYWLAFEVFGAPTALLASFLMAFARWPLIFSRWGYIGAMLIALGCLAAAALLAALRTRRRRYGMLAGLLAGLALHTHPSSVGVIAALAVFSLVISRDHAARGVVLAVWLAAIVAVSPYAWGFVQHPENFGGRLRDVAITHEIGGRPQIPMARSLPFNLLEYSGVLLFTFDGQARHTLPQKSAVSLLVGVAAMLGIGCGIGRAIRGSRPDALLLAMGAGGLAAGVFSNIGSAPNLHRICFTMGPVMILAARSLRTSLSAVAAPVRPGVAAAALVTVVLTTETLPFLTQWPAHREVRRQFCPAATSAGYLRRTLGDSDTVAERGLVPYPLVLDILIADEDLHVPVAPTPERTVDELLDEPPSRPFLYVAKPESLSALRAAGWRCARGVAVAEDVRHVVIARVRPPLTTSPPAAVSRPS
jgi:hypothetical protein